jgi:hypothetical protein
MKRAVMAGAAAALTLGLAGPAWAATSVVIQSVPLPSGGTSGTLLGVSCVSPADCMTVGSYRSAPSKVDQPVAGHWDGTAWSVTPVPLPAGGISGKLDGISCTSAADCTAVGSYVSDGGPAAGLPLAEHWDGSAWSARPVPVPSGASGILTAVSCSATAACTAAGSDTPVPATAIALAERWNGTTWTQQPVPAGDELFTGVSCAAARGCTAVGVSDGGTVAAQWNGTSWANSDPVIPPGADFTTLTAVFCVSPANCTAVGDDSLAALLVPLAEHWNGSAWSAEPAAVPAGTATSVLTSVSCPSARTCTAAGSYTKDTPGTRPLAEFFNGTAWTQQPTAAPATHKMLDAISCTAAHVCTMTGRAQRPAPGFTSLLAERES